MSRRLFALGWVLASLGLSSAGLASTTFRAGSQLIRSDRFSPWAIPADVDGDGNLEIVGTAGLPPIDSIIVWRMTAPGSPLTQWAIPVHTPLEQVFGAGDWNADGRGDVITGFGDSISLYLGQADGTLSPRGLAAGSGYDAASIGDVTTDGTDDVVISRYFDDVLEIIPGSAGGSGGAPLAPMPTIHHPDEPFVVDWNGDGRNDLLVHGPVPGRYGIHRAIAGGGFAPIDSVTVPAAGRFLDVNGDGIVDLLTEAGHYPGLGGGTFGPLVPSDLQIDGVADFDGDGRLDLYGVRRVFDTEIQVQRARGDGGFDPAGPGPAASSSVALGFTVGVDLDHDTRTDIVGFSWDRQYVAFYRGAGNARFDSPPRKTASSGATMIRLVDLDEDGQRDALITASVANVLEWRRGLGDGNFEGPTLFPTLAGTSWLRCADLDGDGDADVVAASPSSSAFSVWIAEGGLPAPRTDFTTTGSPQRLWLLEATGDGRPDVLANVGAAGVLRFANDGAGGFGPGALVDLAGATDVAAADVDHDGDLDFVSVTSTNLRLHRRSGPGTFDPAISVAIPPPAVSATLALADLDGDGWTDALVHDRRLFVFRGQPGGTFAPPVVSPRAIPDHLSPSRDILARDLDGDGAIDAVTSFEEGGAAVIWRGRGDGTLAPEDYLGVTSTGSVSDLDVADLDGDSRPDIAVLTGRSGGGAFGVLLQNLAIVDAPPPPLPGSRLRLALAMNPVGDRVRGTISGAVGPVDLALLDITGRRVRHQRLDGTASHARAFDLGTSVELPPGRYVLFAREGAEHTRVSLVVIR